MGELFGIVSDISPAIKLGWLVFAVWTTVQVLWHRRANAAVPAPAQPARRRRRSSSSRRPAAIRPSTEGTQQFLSSLGVGQSEGATRYGVPMSHGRSGPTIIS